MNQTVKNVALGSVGAAGLFLASGAVANASEVHTVSSNDTVWALAQKYGVSQDSIEKQNNINPQTHIIYQGQKLTINSDSTQSQPKTKTNGSYTVKAGDSLWTIAQSAGISVAQLRQANGLDLSSAVIQPGQSLNLTMSKQASQVTVDTNANAQVSSTPQVSEQSESTKTSAKQQSVSTAVQTGTSEVKAPETTSEVKSSTDEVNTESSNAQTRETNDSVTKSVTAQERSQVSKQAESASSTTEIQQPVERKAATSSIKQQTVSNQNVSKPVQKKVVQPKAQQPTVSQKLTNSTQTQKTTPKQNVSTSEAAAKEWIAQKESGGSYTAKNGQYYGRYQLTDAYLNHDYSAANQEKVANTYVTSAYGSWNGAKTFWLQNGWY